MNTTTSATSEITLSGADSGAGLTFSLVRHARATIAAPTLNPATANGPSNGLVPWVKLAFTAEPATDVAPASTTVTIVGTRSLNSPKIRAATSKTPVAPTRTSVHVDSSCGLKINSIVSGWLMVQVARNATGRERLGEEKRVPDPRFEVTVLHLLDRDRADALSFVDKAGDTYRQFY